MSRDEVELDAELERRLVRRARAWGEDPREWLHRAVDRLLHDRPEPLAAPPDVEIPLFVYGALQPGEVAHEQIRQHVKVASEATLDGWQLRTRDGLPIANKALRQNLRGFVLEFRRPTAAAAYDIVRQFEPAAQYRWETVEAHTQEGTHLVNVLAARRPDRGTADEIIPRWRTSEDPVLAYGLGEAALLALELSHRPVGEDLWFFRPFFRLQAAFLLTMTVAERYTALAYGAALSPMERIRLLEQSPDFVACIKESEVRTGRRVFDSRDPGAKVVVGDDGANAWKFWYQVRSNLAHRGKGAFRDAEIVSEALIDVHDVLRLLLLLHAPGIVRNWRQVDEVGEQYRWRLRPRLWHPSNAPADTE